MATRFYFPLSTAADVSPAYESAWAGVTTQALRRKLVTAKGSSAITAGSTIDLDATWLFGLDRQYVSDPMPAGQNINGTVTGQLLVREFDAADNVNYLLIMLRVVSEDGGTVRATLLSLTDYAHTTEFLETGFRNKTIADGDTVSSYTTVTGDRLVLEIGYGFDAGTTPQGAAKWGENATDLPINETQTTDGAGWLEISNTLTFGAAAAAVTGTATASITEADVRAGGKTIILTLTGATWITA